MNIISSREMKGKETKERIFNTVKELIEEYGYQYVTIRNICEVAEISFGSFYNYFQSKENLFYLYGTQIFENMLQKYLLPTEIQEGNFVQEIVWNLTIYALFCEKMGKEFIKYVCQNCSTDIFFQKCFDDKVIKILKKGMEDGYLHMNPDMLYMDLEILYKGVVHYWCNSNEKKEEINELPNIMQRVLIKFLYSFATEKYVKQFPYESIPNIILIIKNTY